MKGTALLVAAPVGGYFLARRYGFSPLAGAAVGLLGLGISRALAKDSGPIGRPMGQTGDDSGGFTPLTTAWNYWTKWGVRGGLENVAYEAQEAADAAASSVGQTYAAAQDAYEEELQRREKERRLEQLKRWLKWGGIGILALAAAGGSVAGVRAVRRRNPSKGPSWAVVGLLTTLSALDAATPGIPFPGSAAIILPITAATWVAKLSAMGAKVS